MTGDLRAPVRRGSLLKLKYVMGMRLRKARTDALGILGLDHYRNAVVEG